jgi:hypothetical protein
MPQQPQWTGNSETFVNPAQTEMQRRIASLRSLYRLTRDEKVLDRAVDLEMEYIRRFQAVEEVVPYLEGYESGVYIIGGKRILVCGPFPEKET